MATDYEALARKFGGKVQEDDYEALARKFGGRVQDGVPWASGGRSGGSPDVMGQFGSFIRGVRDPVDAGAQMLVRGANAVGLAPDSEVSRVEGINRAAEQDFQQNWRGGNAPPIDLPRMAGFGLVTGPMAAPSKVAGSILGRSAQAGRAGAIGGAFTGVEAPKDNKDFLLKKGGQIAVGGLTGAIGQPIIEGGLHGIANIAASVINRGAGAAGGLVGGWTENAAEKIARESLRARGISFDDLNAGVQQSLISDVQTAMKRYGGVSASALARQADFQELGVDPIKAWVTRDPIDFGKAKNLEATDAGDALKKARAALDAQLLSRIEGLRGRNMGTQFESGVAAGSALRSADDAARGKVNSLYAQARASTGKDLDVPLTGLAQSYASVLDDFADKVPTAVRNKFNALGLDPANPSNQRKQFTIEDADKLLKSINEHVGNDAATNRALSKLREAVKTAVTEADATGGPFAPAVAAAKERFAAHDAIPALRAVADGSFEPEKFFSQFVIGGSVKDVAAMWGRVDSKELKDAVRSRLVDALKDAARGKGQSDEAATFAQARFAQFLESPGMPEKLKIILGPKGAADIGLVQRTSEAAIKAPAGSRWNTSGSAMELMNLSRRLPMVGPLISDPLRGLYNDAAAATAQRAGPAAIRSLVVDPNTEAMLLRLRRASGLLAPAVGGSAAGFLGGP